MPSRTLAEAIQRLPLFTMTDTPSIADLLTNIEAKGVKVDEKALRLAQMPQCHLLFAPSADRARFSAHHVNAITGDLMSIDACQLFSRDYARIAKEGYALCQPYDALFVVAAMVEVLQPWSKRMHWEEKVIFAMEPINDELDPKNNHEVFSISRNFPGCANPGDLALSTYVAAGKADGTETLFASLMPDRCIVLRRRNV